MKIDVDAELMLKWPGGSRAATREDVYRWMGESIAKEANKRLRRVMVERLEVLCAAAKKYGTSTSATQVVDAFAASIDETIDDLRSRLSIELLRVHALHAGDEE